MLKGGKIKDDSKNSVALKAVLRYMGAGMMNMMYLLGKWVTDGERAKWVYVRPERSLGRVPCLLRQFGLSQRCGFAKYGPDFQYLLHHLLALLVL